MTAPTPEQAFATLMQELSASASTPLTASTDTVPAPNLTLREAVNAILWVTNAAVDMAGTGSANGPRPWSPTIPDTILGHVLSLRLEGLITQAIVTELAAKAGVDVVTIRQQVVASLNPTLKGAHREHS